MTTYNERLMYCLRVATCLPNELYQPIEAEVTSTNNVNNKEEYVKVDKETLLKIVQIAVDKWVPLGAPKLQRPLPITIQKLGVNVDSWLGPLNDAMKSANITTSARKAAFLAQVLTETGALTRFEEMGNSKYFKKYDNNQGLGNTEPGDGEKFKGRGIVQLTGRDAYTAASQYIFGDMTLRNNPDKAEEPEIAAKIATWFWTVYKKENVYEKVRVGKQIKKHKIGEKNINDYADQYKIQKVSKILNGGNKAKMERYVYYKAALEVLKDPNVDKTTLNGLQTPKSAAKPNHPSSNPAAKKAGVKK